MPLDKQIADEAYAKIYGRLPEFCTTIIETTDATDIKGKILQIVGRVIAIRNFEELSVQFFMQPIAKNQLQLKLADALRQFDSIYPDKLPWFKRAIVKTIIEVSQGIINAERHTREDTLEHLLAENEKIQAGIKTTENEIKVDSQKKLFIDIFKYTNDYFLGAENISKINSQLEEQIHKEIIVERIIKEINDLMLKEKTKFHENPQTNYLSELLKNNRKQYDIIRSYIESHLEKITVLYDTIDRRILNVNGANLTVENLSEIVNQKLFQNKELSEVHIVLTHNLIIDSNLDLPGISILVQAKRIFVQHEYIINTSGKDAEEFTNATAENGGAESKTAVKQGLPGEDGQDGAAGESAGHITLEAEEIIRIEKLKLCANGGNGSKGQNGGNGQDGLDGKDGRDGKAEDKSKKLTSYNYSLDKGTQGTHGHAGGKGGSAGLGGKGGYAGKITLIFNNIVDPYGVIGEIKCSNGIDGLDGQPGKGGKGGHDGRDGIDEGYAWRNQVVRRVVTHHRGLLLEPKEKKTWYKRKYYKIKVIRTEDEIKHSNELKKQHGHADGKDGKEALVRKNQAKMAVEKPTIRREDQKGEVISEMILSETTLQTETLTQRLAFMRGQQQTLFVQMDTEQRVINQLLALGEDIFLLGESAIDQIEQNTALQQQLLRISMPDGQIHIRDDVYQELLSHKQKNFPIIRKIDSEILNLLESVINQFSFSEDMQQQKLMELREQIIQFLINYKNCKYVESDIIVGKIEIILLYGLKGDIVKKAIRELIKKLLNTDITIKDFIKQLDNIMVKTCYECSLEDEFLKLVIEIVYDKLEDNKTNLEKIRKFERQFLQLLDAKQNKNKLLPDNVQALIRQKMVAKDNHGNPIGIVAKVFKQSPISRFTDFVGLTESTDKKIKLKENVAKKDKLRKLISKNSEIKNKEFNVKAISLTYLSEEIITDRSQCHFEQAILQYNKHQNKQNLLYTFDKFTEALDKYIENGQYSLAIANRHASRYLTDFLAILQLVDLSLIEVERLTTSLTRYLEKLCYRLPLAKEIVLILLDGYIYLRNTLAKNQTSIKFIEVVEQRLSGEHNKQVNSAEIKHMEELLWLHYSDLEQYSDEHITKVVFALSRHDNGLTFIKFISGKNELIEAVSKQNIKLKPWIQEICNLIENGQFIPASIKVIELTKCLIKHEDNLTEEIFELLEYFSKLLDYSNKSCIDILGDIITQENIPLDLCKLFMIFLAGYKANLVDNLEIETERKDLKQKKLKAIVLIEKILNRATLEKNAQVYFFYTAYNQIKNVSVRNQKNYSLYSYEHVVSDLEYIINKNENDLHRIRYEYNMIILLRNKKIMSEDEVHKLNSNYKNRYHQNIISIKLMEFQLSKINRELVFEFTRKNIELVEIIVRALNNFRLFKNTVRSENRIQMAQTIVDTVNNVAWEFERISKEDRTLETAEKESIISELQQYNPILHLFSLICPVDVHVLKRQTPEYRNGNIKHLLMLLGNKNIHAPMLELLQYFNKYIHFKTSELQAIFRVLKQIKNQSIETKQFIREIWGILIESFDSKYLNKIRHNLFLYKKSQHSQQLTYLYNEYQSLIDDITAILYDKSLNFDFDYIKKVLGSISNFSVTEKQLYQTIEIFKSIKNSILVKISILNKANATDNLNIELFLAQCCEILSQKNLDEENTVLLLVKLAVIIKFTKINLKNTEQLQQIFTELNKIQPKSNQLIKAVSRLASEFLNACQIYLSEQANKNIRQHQELEQSWKISTEAYLKQFNRIIGSLEGDNKLRMQQNLQAVECNLEKAYAFLYNTYAADYIEKFRLLIDRINQATSEVTRHADKDYLDYLNSSSQSILMIINVAIIENLQLTESQINALFKNQTYADVGRKKDNQLDSFDEIRFINNFLAMFENVLHEIQGFISNNDRGLLRIRNMLSSRSVSTINTLIDELSNISMVFSRYLFGFEAQRMIVIKLANYDKRLIDAIELLKEKDAAINIEKLKSISKNIKASLEKYNNVQTELSQFKLLNESNIQKIDHSQQILLNKVNSKIKKIILKRQLYYADGSDFNELIQNIANELKKIRAYNLSKVKENIKSIVNLYYTTMASKYIDSISTISVKKFIQIISDTNNSIEFILGAMGYFEVIKSRFTLNDLKLLLIGLLENPHSNNVLFQETIAMTFIQIDKIIRKIQLSKKTQNPLIQQLLFVLNRLKGFVTSFLTKEAIKLIAEAYISIVSLSLEFSQIDILKIDDKFFIEFIQNNLKPYPKDVSQMGAEDLLTIYILNILNESNIEIFIFKLSSLNYILSKPINAIKKSDLVLRLIEKLHKKKNDFSLSINKLLDETLNHLRMQTFHILSNDHQIIEEEQKLLWRILVSDFYINHISLILKPFNSGSTKLLDLLMADHQNQGIAHPVCYCLANESEKFYCDIIIACNQRGDIDLLHYLPEKKWLNKLYQLAKDACYKNLITACEFTIQSQINVFKQAAVTDTAKALLDSVDKIFLQFITCSDYENEELERIIEVLNQLNTHFAKLPLFKQQFVPLINQLLDFKVNYSRSLTNAKVTSHERSWFELMQQLANSISHEWTLDSTQKLKSLNTVLNQIDNLENPALAHELFGVYSIADAVCQILLFKIEADTHQFLQNTMIAYEEHQQYFDTIRNAIRKYDNNQDVLELFADKLTKEISISDEVARITPNELVVTLLLLIEIPITESTLLELHSKSLLYWHAYLRELQLQLALSNLELLDEEKKTCIGHLLKLERMYGSDFIADLLSIIKSQGTFFRNNTLLSTFLSKALLFSWSLASMTAENRKNLNFTDWQNNLSEVEESIKYGIKEDDLKEMMQATQANDSIRTNISNFFRQAAEVKKLENPFRHRNKREIEQWLNQRKQTASQEELEKEPQIINLLAVIAQAVNIVFGYYPRITQYIAVLIYIDAFIQQKGRLGQISTGEGKSLITAMLAVAFTYLNKKVDVITSSSVLAIRDSVKQDPETGETNKLFEFFEILGLTVANNCDEACQKNPGIVKERYAADIVYGDCASFQRDILLTYFLGEDLISHRRSSLHDDNNQNVLIVDEVDSMLLDKGSNVLYLSHEISDLRFLKSLYVYIWSGVNAPDIQFLKPAEAIPLIKNYIDMTLREGHLTIPESLQKFYERRIDSWIEHALIAKRMQKDDTYIMNRTKQGMQVTVMDKDTGVEQTDTHWSHGLHQFLQLKHTQKLSNESLKAIFMSSLSYFRLYTNHLYGLTGTLGSAAEQKLLSKIYGVDFFILPRFQFRRYEEQSAEIFFENDSALWLESIARDVTEKITHHRSVLVICDNIAIVNQLEAYLQTIDGVNIKTYSSAFQKFDIGTDTRPLEPRDVIIATNLAGRGMDLKLSEEVKNAGGLHVIITYLPENVRIGEQASGRPARNGDPGSCKLIITTSLNEKNIDKLERIRDSIEEQRLEQFRLRELISNNVLEVLFDRFHELYQEIENDLKKDILQAKVTDGYYSWTKKKLKEIKVPFWQSKRLTTIKLDEQYVKLQLKSLLDHWAFWLDKMDNIIKDSYLLGEDAIYQRYEKFKSKMQNLSRSYDIFKLVTLPNELNKLALYFYSKNYQTVAQRCFDKSILIDPNYAEMAHYYKAASLLKSGDYTFETKLAVKESLKKAKTILHDRSNILQNSNQALIQIMLLTQRTGDGTYDNEFQKQITNECKIIQTFLGSIDDILGRNIFNCDFENIHGLKNDVEVKKLFNHVVSNLDIIKKYRLSKRLKVITIDGIKELVKTGKRTSTTSKIRIPEEFRFYQESIFDAIDNHALNFENLESIINTRSEFIGALKSSRHIVEHVLVENVIVIDEEQLERIKFSSDILKEYQSEIFDILRAHENERYSFEQFNDLFNRKNKLDVIHAEKELLKKLKGRIIKPDIIFTLKLNVKDDGTIIIPGDLITYEKTIHYLFALPQANTKLDMVNKTQHCSFRIIDIPLVNDKNQAVKQFWDVLIQQGAVKNPVLDISLKDTKTKKIIEKKLKEIAKQLTEKLTESDCQELGIVLEKKEYEKFITSLTDALQKTVGLIKSLPRIKVKEVELEQYFQTGDLPPEIYEYQRIMFNHLIQLVEKPPFWNWNAFAVAMLGLAQIAAGVALVVFTAGIGATIGESFISEGIGDIIFSVQAAIRGKFSWKEYAISKAISLTISVITLGIGAAIQAVSKSAKAAQAISTTVVDAAEDVVAGTANVTVLSAGQATTHTAASTVASTSKTVLFQGTCKKVLSTAIKEFGTFTAGVVLDKIFDSLPEHLKITFEKQLYEALNYKNQRSASIKIEKYQLILKTFKKIEDNLTELYFLCETVDKANKIAEDILSHLFGEQSQLRDKIVSTVGNLVKGIPGLMMDNSKDIAKHFGKSNSSIYAIGLILRIAATVINSGFIAYRALSDTADALDKLASRISQKNALLRESNSKDLQRNKNSCEEFVEQHMKKIKSEILDSMLKEFSKNILQAEVQEMIGFAVKNLTDKFIKIPEFEKALSKNNGEEANELMDQTQNLRNLEIDQSLESRQAATDAQKPFQISNGIVNPNDSAIQKELLRNKHSINLQKDKVFRDRKGELIIDNNKSSIKINPRRSGHKLRVQAHPVRARHYQASRNHGRHVSRMSTKSTTRSIATNVSSFFSKSHTVSTAIAVGLNIIRLGGLVVVEKLCADNEYKAKCLEREKIILQVQQLNIQNAAEEHVRTAQQQGEALTISTETTITLRKLETKQHAVESEIRIMEAQLKTDIFAQLAALIELDEIRVSEEPVILAQELLSQCLATKSKLEAKILSGTEEMLNLLKEIKAEYQEIILEKFPPEIARKIEEQLQMTSEHIENKLYYAMHAKEMELDEISNTHDIIQSNAIDITETLRHNFTF